MTSIKMLGSLGLLLGLAMVLTMAAGAGHGRPPKRNLDELTIFDSKDAFGYVVRDGDRFVALRIPEGDNKLGYLHNFDRFHNGLKVDDRYLGYDLSGKNKNVLVREKAGEDIRWKLVLEVVRTPKERRLVKRFQVKNGELKGWLIGLGPVEPAKKESKWPRDQYKRAPLILVKDKKDAAGFSYSLDPPDDGK